MNHILRIAPSTGLQQLSAYNDPNLPLARQLVEAVSRFILRGAEAEKAAEPLQKSLPAPTSSESRPVKAAGQRMSDDR